MQYFKFAKLTLRAPNPVWKCFFANVYMEGVGIVDYLSSGQLQTSEDFVYVSHFKSIPRTHANFLFFHTFFKLHLQNCPKECRQHWMGVIWRVQARPPLRLAALLAAPLRGSVWCIVVCSMYFSPVVCFWQIILWSISDSSLKAVTFSCCHFQWFHIVHCNKIMQLFNVMFVICICFCSWLCVWAFSALLNSHSSLAA